MTFRDDLVAFAERPLDPEAARAYVEAPVTDAERQDVLALVDWFTRRYPEPLERLAYARRAYARWRRSSLRRLETGS